MWYRQVFKVKGHGSFPLDMLRYDQCWPHSGASVGAIERSQDEGFGLSGIGGPPDEPGPREVTLVRHVDDKHRLPTEGRWDSFGWKVVKGSVLTEKL
jgi:hypothetical protein